MPAKRKRNDYPRKSIAKDRAKRKARREMAKKIPGQVTAPDEAPRQVQPHGGALLRGGVPGNRGGHMAQLRRDVRKRLLRVLRTGQGLELLAQIVDGSAKNQRVMPDGSIVEFVSRETQLSALRTALEYGAGTISQHTVANENDEVLESGVVQLPMLDAPPQPPPDGDGTAAPAPSLTEAARAKALDAAEALIRAAR